MSNANEKFEEFIKTHRVFTARDVVQADVVVSMGYTFILIQRAIGKGLIEEIEGSKPRQYRVL